MTVDFHFDRDLVRLRKTIGTSALVQKVPVPMKRLADDVVADFQVKQLLALCARRHRSVHVSTSSFSSCRGSSNGSGRSPLLTMGLKQSACSTDQHRLDAEPIASVEPSLVTGSHFGKTLILHITYNR